jgi:catechol-2,3-dioxygenase
MDPQVPGPDRRKFLAHTSAAAALIAAHEAAAPEAAAAPGEKPGGGPRIVSLTLLTAAPLAKMKDFYQKTIGLRLLEDAPDRLTVAAGQSRLTFVPAGEGAGEPFYHFAFNIPENKIRAARDWQLERTPLLPIPARLRDPKFPADVVDYRHWEAHSVFFFDPAGNVVEYIARHTLKNPAPGPFSADDILCASEIALVVDEVRPAAATLKEVAGVGQYRGGDDHFTALGDEHGLLLVMKRGRSIAFDSPRKRLVDVFRTAVSVRGPKAARHLYPGFPYEITVGA